MFAGVNSVCYFVCDHEAKVVGKIRIIPSLWTYKQDRGVTLGRSSHSGLYILLILAGDVEVCPGSGLKCFICSKTIRRNHSSECCSQCKRLSHLKCLKDKLLLGREILPLFILYMR